MDLLIQVQSHISTCKTIFCRLPHPHSENNFNEVLIFVELPSNAAAPEFAWRETDYFIRLNFQLDVIVELMLSKLCLKSTDCMLMGLIRRHDNPSTLNVS
jgi:hypothetical protein